NHCHRSADDPPLSGSAMVANDSPMPWLTSSPARRPASNAIRSIMPIAMPTLNSRSTGSAVAASTAIGGGAGNTADSAADSASVTISRACAGMPRPAITGSTCSAAPMRSAYQSTAASMPNRSTPAIDASETVSTRRQASADQVRDAVEQVDGEGDHAPEQEMPGGGHHHHQADHLDHERDGRLVDLGGGLQHADGDADHQHRDQRRAAEGERHLQAA